MTQGSNEGQGKGEPVKEAAEPATRIIHPAPLSHSPLNGDDDIEQARKAVAAMVKTPPIIRDRSEAERVVPLRITIMLPIEGEALRQTFRHCFLGSIDAIQSRLELIADIEEMDISTAQDNEKKIMYVRLSQKAGIQYTKPMEPESLAFIRTLYHSFE